MLVVPSDFQSTVDTICQKSIDTNTSVLIISAADVDALSASCMLKELFETPLSYTIVYVNGYDDIFKKIRIDDEDDDEDDGSEQKLDLDQFKVVVTLNWGGGFPLTEVFQRNDITFLVIDSQRPLDLDNVGDDNVYILDDGSTIDTISSLDFGDDDDEDDESDSEDSPKKRAKKSVFEKYTDGEVHKEQLRKYYEGSHYIKSSAALVYDLLSAMGRRSVKSAWWAVLGLTDQFVNDKIDSATYGHFAADFQVKHLPGDEATSDMSVTHSLEPRFFLMRHWSIYESMVHSRFVVSRLPVWTQDGKEQLNDLFAKVGFKLEDCYQAYSAVKQKDLEVFFSRLKGEEQRVSVKFDIEDMFFLSFLLKRMGRTPLSASDVVHAVDGVLNHKFDDNEQRFEMAIDILSLGIHFSDAFNKGVQWAKAQQRAVVMEVSKAFVIASTNPKIMYNHHQIKGENGSFFTQHKLLDRLANFLVDVRRHSSLKRWPLQQQVVSVPCGSEWVLVAGVWCRVDPLDEQKNVFVSLFENAAGDSRLGYEDGVDYHFPFFERNTMKIQAMDEKPEHVLLKLQTSVNAMMKQHKKTMRERRKRTKSTTADQL
eukprot:m.242305 g.242305  ORF g.242305 m.242305 type:complete len:595 (-) comp32311_c0_seq1:101-1885(-)